MERTIKITGTGKIAADPDQIILNITLHESFKTYEQANENMIESKRELDEILNSLNIDTKEAKTTYLNISPEYKSVRINGTYENKLTGYAYSHDLTLAIDLDNELLSNILNKTKESKHNPRIDIAYSLKNKESFKNRLIASAVKDSRKKALVLTKSLDVKLKEVISIDYSWSKMDIRTDFIYRLDETSPASAKAISINPEKIELEDTVTVIWSIE